MNAPERKQYGQVDEDPTAHSSHLGEMVKYYAKTADKYNSWHCDPDDESSHNYAVREIVSVMSETQSNTALDVCCGTGRALKALLDRGFDCTGIDVSPELLKIAKSEHGIPENRLILGDATSLPFPDNSFDVSCILGALHHTAMPEKMVAEMIRVTRNAVVISDEANRLFGGIKQILIALGLFEPIYRLVFSRPPRQQRRMGVSDTDGPTYLFSIEEIIPLVRSNFRDFRCLSFYRIGPRQICAPWLPRIFARHGVVVVKHKEQRAPVAN